MNKSTIINLIFYAHQMSNRLANELIELNNSFSDRLLFGNC
ncbi:MULTISPECIES: hypothetical protein [Okeania]|nr:MULTISPECIES: hypothetical protein [Okeania]